MAEHDIQIKNTCKLYWDACGARLWEEAVSFYTFTPQLDRIPPERTFRRQNDIGKGGQLVELTSDLL